MDFKDQIRILADRILQTKGRVNTEEATKHSFVMPFIQCLGYDIFNPHEVIPEFVADLGIKQGEKVDYAILKDEKPIILVECKWHGANLDVHNSQLFRYFHVSHAKFGLLTNGIEYRFYTDLVSPNKMDDKPFFVFNLTDIKDAQVDELKKFHKNYYDHQTIINTASELKYTNELKNLIHKLSNEPTPEFVRFMARDIYHGVITQKVLDLFTVLVKKSYNQYHNDLINDRLTYALQKEEEKQVLDIIPIPVVEGLKIETTQEELDAFYIIRAILRAKVAIGRIHHRDAQSYFSIILDDNNRKPICRLQLSGKKKFISLFDTEKEVKVEIKSVDDIYGMADKLLSTIEKYLAGKQTSVS